MDDNEFKRLLSQFAEWEYPKVVPSNKEGPKKRGRRSVEELEWEENEEDMIDQPLKHTTNTTLAPKIIKIKKEERECEDCGRMCVDRRVDIRFVFFPKKLIKKTCSVCKKHQDPRTGEFNLSGNIAKAVYQAQLNNRNLKRSKYNAISLDTYEVSEDGTSIIRKLVSENKDDK